MARSNNLRPAPLALRPPQPALARLPTHLAERARVLGPGGANAVPAGRFVLCWLRCALRAEENPALDAALALSRALGVPVLVYLGLPEQSPLSPYASDRLHWFQLEAMRELLPALRAHGVSAVAHVERPGHEQPVLEPLAGQAAAVVLDDVPLGVLQTWAERLARASPAPVLAVDAACVVPMEVVGRAYDRAFAFRDRTAAERSARVDAPWTGEPATGPASGLALPFEPLALEALDDQGLAALVASCAIDHSVPRVEETRGGSAAGYARWDAFRADGLSRYAKDRNDPLLPAVSRMSPYLHFGCVSALRLAREASAAGGAGAGKFLDELLIWRELAWSFCRFTAEPESLAALPGWARRTLEERASDARPAKTWEQLASARSGDALWDACQRSLLRHGELHNNLRMTWGKALPLWTPSPARALELLVDLNHRYALDGGDPASLGGILWCLGQFDRPFSPEVPVLGAVRPRPLSWHAGRLDVPEYQRQVSRPARGGPRRVAVIGAGLAGLACARVLVDQGVEVTLFDKGRAPGGRLATRRVDGFSFDHGAQFFTAREPGFTRRVHSWVEQGLVAEWRPREVEIALGLAGREQRAVTRSEPRFVGQPGMSALAGHLAQGLDVRRGVRITGAAREQDGIFVVGSAEARGDGAREPGPTVQRAPQPAPESVREGPFDALAVALPAPQAVALLETIAPALVPEALRARLSPCLALLAGFAAPLGLPFDAAAVRGSPIAWIARSASKPGRGSEEAWVVHASAAWSEALLELDPAQAAPLLLAALAEAAGEPLPAPRLLQVHRWRYALASAPLGGGCLFDRDALVGACGDWCAGARVEAAWLSGVALAGRLLEPRVAARVSG